MQTFDRDKCQRAVGNRSREAI